MHLVFSNIIYSIQFFFVYLNGIPAMSNKCMNFHSKQKKMFRVVIFCGRVKGFNLDSFQINWYIVFWLCLWMLYNIQLCNLFSEANKGCGEL